MRVFNYEPCNPPIEPIRLGATESSSVTERMRELFTDDQMPRQSPTSNWDMVAREDAQRRQETLRYLVNGHISTAETLYFAAVIFQHGNCPDHYELAHQLAEESLQRGYAPAGLLYAATLDRALMSRGLPQKFGTQYVSYDDGPLEMYLYDPSTTDEDRQRYGVPPLHELLQQREPER